MSAGTVALLATSTLSLVAVVVVGVAGVRGRARSAAHTAPGRTARGAVLLGFATLTALGPVLVELPDAIRAVPTFAVALFAPGLALLGFGRVRDPLTELVLALAISVATLVLVAELMLLVGAWSPATLFAALCLLAAPAVAWHGANFIDPADRRPREDDVVA